MSDHALVGFAPPGRPGSGHGDGRVAAAGKLPRRRWFGRQGGAAGGPGAAPRAGLWVVLHEAWRRHRTRQCLLEQDGYLLKDIGVGYAEAEAEGNKPFWVA